MSTAPDIIILSAGGHARVVIDVLARAGKVIAGLTDADAKLHGSKLDGVPVLGGDDIVLARDPKSVVLVNALGNMARAGNAGLGLRRRLFETFKSKTYSFAQVLSPDAVISRSAELHEGCHVLTGAIVHPGCVVGANVVINTGAQLDHDCIVGAHSHIAPGAILCGNVKVGDEAFVGAGSVIVQGIKIGERAVVGAGAVVVGDVPPGATVLGNPARITT